MQGSLTMDIQFFFDRDTGLMCGEIGLFYGDAVLFCRDTSIAPGAARPFVEVVTSHSSLWTPLTKHGAVCCSALQCVAVCCSVLQCVAVCCSVLQFVSRSGHVPLQLVYATH